jgi:hypothetical protein
MSEMGVPKTPSGAQWESGESWEVVLPGKEHGVGEVGEKEGEKEEALDRSGISDYSNPTSSTVSHSMVSVAHSQLCSKSVKLKIYTHLNNS